MCLILFKKVIRKFPEKQIIGQRNILAHDYGDILVERIYQTSVENIPSLIEHLKLLVSD